jgi:hypothetical protein
MISGITAHGSDSGSLVDSDIVDKVGSGEGEVGKVDFLEIVRHSKVEDLDVSHAHEPRATSEASGGYEWMR